MILPPRLGLAGILFPLGSGPPRPLPHWCPDTSPRRGRPRLQSVPVPPDKPLQHQLCAGSLRDRGTAPTPTKDVHIFAPRTLSAWPYVAKGPFRCEDARNGRLSRFSGGPHVITGALFSGRREGQSRGRDVIWKQGRGGVGQGVGAACSAGAEAGGRGLEPGNAASPRGPGGASPRRLGSSSRNVRPAD